MTVAVPAPNTGLLLGRYAPYVLSTWWYGRSYPHGIPTITWTAGNAYSQELAVRGAAMNAFTLATTSFTNVTIGLEPNVPTDVGAARLLAAVARQHVANPAGAWQQWGNSWQSPLWAAWTGLAAMISWDCIPNSTERDNVLNMLESEADYVVASRPPLFWTDANHVEQYPGDSKAEENSWCATVCWVASALMPLHPNADEWVNAAIELGWTAFTAPQDEDPRGYNVTSDLLIVNHNRVHPDYMTTVSHNFFGRVAWRLAGRVAPIPAHVRIGTIWRAFQVAEMDEAQTVAYNPATPNVSFPVGTPNDWGVRRPAAYAALDGLVGLYGLEPPETPVGWGYWNAIHTADLSAMQARAVSVAHPAGSFVLSGLTPPESTYPEENAYAASQIAFLHLARHAELC